MNDLIVSSGLGILLATFIIIYLSHNPGKPFNYSTGESICEDDTSNGNKIKISDPGEIQNEDNKESIPQLNEDNLVMKSAKIQKVLGLSEDDIRQAVRVTNLQLKSGKLEQDVFTFAKCFRWLIFIGISVGGMYTLNYYSQGDFARILSGLFPREFEALGLKKMIDYHKPVSSNSMSSNNEL